MPVTPDSQERSISVIVATRNRGASIDLTLRSLLACEGIQLRVIVVDQSTNDETELAVRRHIDRGAPITLVRSEETGQSRAINLGLAHVEDEVIAMTDDDCEAPADWLLRVYEALEEFPQVGVLYCSVEAGEHDSKAGWIPIYECDREHLSTRWYHRLGYSGMGAGMAVRRSVMEQIGGFDEELGVGTDFPAANDLDVAVRAMIGGWHVLDTNRTKTIHHGFRTMEEGRKVTAGWIGIGAMCIKHARSGNPHVALLGAWDVTRLAIYPSILDVLRLRKPKDLRRLAYFLQGIKKAARTPVQKERLVFESLAAGPSRIEPHDLAP